MSGITPVLFAAALPAATSLLLGKAYRACGRAFRFYPGWIGGAAAGSLGWAVIGAWHCAAASAANIPVAAFLWWLSRRRRKRAPKLAGYKALALIAALLRKAREFARPCPPLRPSPVGSR